MRYQFSKALFLLTFLVTIITAMPSMAQSQKYTCPMHPHYISLDEGTCPICGMDLVPLEGGEAEEDSAQNTPAPIGKKKILYWQAPMDPNYKMDKPGKSPMGMDLVPIYAEEPIAETGRTVVKIDSEMIQNSGVRSEKAQMSNLGVLVRSYGDITENSRDQFDISSRVEGWINELNVKAEGDVVKKGDLLLTLYSPQLVSSQSDLISALKSGSTSIANSASKRLVALGMQKQAISEVKKRRKVFQNVPFYAESDGIVSKIDVREGGFVRPAMTIMSLQNYNTVWIEASLAEKDIAFVSEKSEVMVSFPTLGVSDIKAEVDYIYPTVDRATRTGRLRLVIDNKDGMLKPGAYADIEFETDAKPRLSIPSDAILKSKEGDFVVTDLGEGRFQPRSITTGLKYKGRTEVVDGLSDGDKVVVSGQFLIDSESALRESFRKMQQMQLSLSALDVGDDQMAMINHLVDAALYLHEELVADRFPNKKMIMPAISTGDHLISTFRGTKLQFILEDAERALQKTQESNTRAQWQAGLNELVTALKPWLLEGRPQYYKSKNLTLYMAHGLDKYWLQLEGSPELPYESGMPMPIEWPDEDQQSVPMLQKEASEIPVGSSHAGH